MIRLQNLTKSFGENTVLKNISLEIKKGESIVMIGPSGGGKSTLLRCLNALEPFESGEATVCGLDMHGIAHQKLTKLDRSNIRAIRLKVGMVFQQFNLFPHLTVLQNVIEAPVTVLKRNRDECIEEAIKLLNSVNMGNKQDAYPATLSGGQQQRVAIARALAMKPEMMLFDEPTSALDPEIVGEVLSVIKGLVDQEQMTSIIATHEMQFANDVADRVFMLDHEIIESDTPENLFGNPKNERTQSFLKRVRFY